MYENDLYFQKNKAHYESIAIDTVISYFKEQGIRLNRTDFNFAKTSDSRKKYETSFHSNMSSENVKTDSTTVVHVYYDGALKKYIQPKKDAFLNYINGRVGKDFWGKRESVFFSFSWKELDFIELSNSSVEADIDAVKLENVKKKIEKLMALADFEKNPSEQEAISASMKVQKLLKEYHLTMADVLGENASSDEAMEQVIADVGSGSSLHNWRFDLACVVAGGYCCKQYRSGSGRADKDRVVFFGHREDVISARRVYTYLFNVGNKLGHKHEKEQLDNSKAYQSFCLGFVDGIKEVLEQNCTALALIVQPEVEEAFDIFTQDFSKARSRSRTIDGRSFKEGKIEGRMAMSGHFIE